MTMSDTPNNYLICFRALHRQQGTSCKHTCIIMQISPNVTSFLKTFEQPNRKCQCLYTISVVAIVDVPSHFQYSTSPDIERLFYACFELHRFSRYVLLD